MKRYIKIYRNIDSICSAWNKIYSSSTDMTPYQSFEWNKNVSECYKSNTYIFLNYKIKYFVYYRNQEPLIIAPLAIPKKKNRTDVYAQIIGQYTKSGLLNFIYGNDISDDDFLFLIEQIKEKCRCQIRFYEIGNFTKFDRFLSTYEDAERISNRFCIKCNAPKTKEEYYNLLSKSVRQTIRTTYNRLNKDGISLNVEIHRGYSFNERELSKINHLYSKRNAEWNNKVFEGKVEDNSHSISSKIVHMFFNNKDAFQNFSDDDSFIYVKCMIDGNIAGFFYALYDSKGYCIVPTLVIDSDFGKYSPGLIMIYEFICREIEKNNLLQFDLSRGNESYKERYLPNPIKYINNDYKL